ncbi:hypothetical protein ABW02_06875 [Niallia circulans]|uniref:Uncharacterized protein n=2 Tax=Niallia circulans TaxID=1397 RepID=A0A0J1IN38_NIACI|nr:hypothetical protein ABW02_06875 [Niallia circulans]
MIQGIRYICLVCSNEETIRCSKEDYKEINVCPNCKGALVDIFKAAQYRKENRINADKKPLLQITLDEENGVPKVFYKGEEIKLNREISFHWETSTDNYVGGLTYVIEHAEPNLIKNRIERRVKGHACD